MSNYDVPYWENVICNMVYDEKNPNLSEFSLVTNCGKIPLFMYRVGTYKDTGIGQDACSGWELNKEYTRFNNGVPKVNGKLYPHVTCSFRRPLLLPESSHM